MWLLVQKCNPVENMPGVRGKVVILAVDTWYQGEDIYIMLDTATESNRII